MDYNRLADRVLKMLTKYGQDITLRQYSAGNGDFDPGTQQVTSEADYTNTTRKALITDQPGQRIGPKYGTNVKTDTLIEDEEKWIYVDAKGPAPKVFDRMIVNDVEFAIADVQVTGPGGIPLYYLVVLRR